MKPDILTITGTRAAIAGLLLAAATSAGTLPATAGGYHDSVHADSFGNLIIYSPSGYKRIVVGQGHLAQELADYSRAGAPEVVDFDPAGEERSARHCRRHGVLLHGRSYMYGLPDNVVPVLRHPCR